MVCTGFRGIKQVTVISENKSSLTLIQGPSGQASRTVCVSLFLISEHRVECKFLKSMGLCQSCSSPYTAAMGCLTLRLSEISLLGIQPASSEGKTPFLSVTCFVSQLGSYALPFPQFPGPGIIPSLFKKTKRYGWLAKEKLYI